MRTKTALLSAACGILAAAAANAQSVYSVNVVGYVNVNLPANQYKMICSPLSGTNTISSAFSSLTDDSIGTYVFIWNNTANSFDYAIYGGTDPVEGGWFDAYGNPANNIALPVGKGFWIKAPADTTVTFVGDVLTGNLSQTIKVGWNMVGSQVPQAVGVDSLSLSGGAGDYIFKWLGGSWGVWIYDPDQGAWYDTSNDNYVAPVLSAGEAVWYKNYNSEFNWTRTFNVN